MPAIFSLGEDRGFNILKSNSPASQEIDCTTLLPLQFAITTNTQTRGNSKLSYNAEEDRYTYPWLTDRGWAGTCRQFILVLDDGTQLRANFRFTP